MRGRSRGSGRGAFNTETQTLVFLSLQQKLSVFSVPLWSSPGSGDLPSQHLRRCGEERVDLRRVFSACLGEVGTSATAAADDRRQLLDESTGLDPRVRSFETDTIRLTRPSFSDAITTTPLTSRSRSVSDIPRSAFFSRPATLLRRPASRLRRLRIVAACRVAATRRRAPPSSSAARLHATGA